MNLKLLPLAAALALTAAVHAQSGPAASAPPAVPSSPAKKELVQKVVKLQTPGLESLAQQLAEQPVAALAQQIDLALQNKVAPDKREAVAKDVQADVKKYLDEAVPMARDRADRFAPGVMGPMLEQRFSEDELKQLVSWLESPVVKKYEQMIPDIQRGMLEKLTGELRPTLEPKARAMKDAIAAHLGFAPAPEAPASAAKKKKK